MLKKCKLSTISIFVIVSLMATMISSTTVSVAKEPGSVIDSLKFDYKITEEYSSGKFKFTGELPQFSLSGPIQPQFFTGEAITPQIEAFLNYDGKSYPVDLEHDCDITYDNNIAVSVSSGHAASITISLKRDPHISATYEFIILPVQGFIKLELDNSVSQYVTRDNNVLYLDGSNAYAELKTIIPYSDENRSPGNLTFQVIPADGGTTTDSVIVELTDDYRLKVQPGDIDGAVKLYFKATDHDTRSFTDTVYEFVIVNNLSGFYIPEFDQPADMYSEALDTIVDFEDIEEDAVPEAAEIKTNIAIEFLRSLAKFFNFFNPAKKNK